MLSNVMDKEDMGRLRKAQLAIVSALGEILSILPLDSKFKIRLQYLESYIVTIAL